MSFLLFNISFSNSFLTLRVVFYSMIFFVILRIGFKAWHRTYYGKDFSSEISAAYRQLKGVKDPDAVDCARVPWTATEYILKMMPNAIDAVQVIGFKMNVLSALGAKFDGIEVAPHEEKAGYYRIFLSKLKKEIDDRGRTVSGIKHEDFPEYPKQYIKYFCGLPVGVTENKQSRYTYYLGWNGRPIFQNDSLDPHILLNGPTNKGKTSMLRWLLLQKYRLGPHLAIVANPIGGAMDFLDAFFAPQDMAAKPEHVARGDWARQLKSMANFFFVGDEDVFCNTVTELAKLIDYRKALLEHFGATDIWSLVDIPAYHADSLWCGRPQQIITLIIDDITGLQAYANGKKTLSEAIDRALEFSTFTRKVGIHVWALSQIATKEFLTMREQFRKIAVGMPALEVSWYLGEAIESPRLLGGFQVVTEFNYIVPGSFPDTSAKMMAESIHQNLLSTHPLTIHETESLIARCKRQGNTLEEYEKIVVGQIKGLHERKIADRPFSY